MNYHIKNINKKTQKKSDPILKKDGIAVKLISKETQVNLKGSTGLSQKKNHQQELL